MRPRIDQRDAATLKVAHVASRQGGIACADDAGDHLVRLSHGYTLRTTCHRDRRMGIRRAVVIRQDPPGQALVKNPQKATHQCLFAPPFGHAAYTEQQLAARDRGSEQRFARLPVHPGRHPAVRCRFEQLGNDIRVQDDDSPDSGPLKSGSARTGVRCGSSSSTPPNGSTSVRMSSMSERPLGGARS